MAGRYKFLSQMERDKISEWYLNGDRPCDIAERLDVHTTTIYNELRRGYTGVLDANQREAYDPILAQRTFQNGLKSRGRRGGAKGAAHTTVAGQEVTT